MTILVCPLSKVDQSIAVHSPDGIVSLLDPGFSFPEVGLIYADRHLRLRFHDIHVPTEDEVMPSIRHVDELLTFLAQWDRTNRILIHCRAGIGRSPATAFIAACFHNPSADEHGIATVLRRVAPFARPNETLIRLADDVMKRNNRMIRAISDTERDVPPLNHDEGEPFEMPSTY